MSEEFTTNWLPVDTESIVDNKVEERDGVEIQIGMSPFDIPQAIRGGYDDVQGKFVIEFQYMDTGSQEELEVIQHF